MRTLILPGAGVRVSRFIFGTGGLLNVGGAARRQRLLLAAADAGFTHFDTSPYYGFGVAERDLAAVLKARPDVTFTTKVGLYPPGGADQHVTTALLRKLLGHGWASLSRPLVDFSLASGRRSLEDSLRRTGRERIDVYLLHDPVVNMVATEEWRKWLESCVDAGKVRSFGMALTAEAARPFLDGKTAFGEVVQLRDSVAGREADVLEHYGRPKQITYGYVSAALRADPRCSVADVLRAALARNPHGAIIVTSGHPERLRQYGELTESSDA